VGRRFALIVLALLAASALSIGTLLEQVYTTHDLHDPRMVVALLVLTASLLVGYVVLYAFAALRTELAAKPGGILKPRAAR
jgi:hypothetical protein